MLNLISIRIYQGYLQSTWLTIVDVDLDYFAKVVLVMFLDDKVTPLLLKSYTLEASDYGQPTTKN